MSVERLTIPDVKLDKNTISRSIIDAEKVKECAMEIYWRLKALEDAVADEESEEYDIDRLRELVEADRAGKCVVLPVLPTLRPGCSKEEVYAVSNDGEIESENVHEILIGMNSEGKLNCLFSTFGSWCFESKSIGKSVFLSEEEAKEAAKGKQK